MKYLLQFSIHSFVDLITNSSSELFICDTDKSLSAFKSIVRKIASGRTEGANLSTLWTNIFQEPEIVKYDFNVDACPYYKEYKELSDWNNKYKHPVIAKCDRELSEFDSNKLNYEAAQKSVDAMTIYIRRRQRITEPGDRIREQARLSVLKWAFDLNNIPWCYRENRPSTGANNWQLNDKFERIASAFSEALSYGFSFKKGAVFLRSASDNTIPWELMDRLESSLPCVRRHIG